MKVRSGKRSAWFAAAAFAVAPAFTACGGGGSAGGGGNGNEGGAGGSGGNQPVGSLERIPGHELTCADPGATTVGETPLLRLTNLEYANSIRDLVAPLTLPTMTTLPRETPTEGYFNFAVGQGATDDLVTSLEDSARGVGDLVSKNLGRLGLDGCPPANADGEKACADNFIATFGGRAYRHVLTDAEKSSLADLYAAARKQNLDFTGAIDVLVEAIVQAPQFLYRPETGTPGGPALKLTDWEMASRLSYFLWDTMPDEPLRAAAAQGALTRDDASLEKEVGRMLDDPRARAATLEFARQWLNFDYWTGNTDVSKKDLKVYSSYSADMSTSMWDGLRLYIEDSLYGADGGLPKLLSSSKGFVNDKTASVYGVNAPNGATLAAVDLDPKQRAGLLTQAAILAGTAHAANQSPIFRGKFVLEYLLCNPPSPPPNNTIPAATKMLPADAVVTTRQRLEMEHEGATSCAGCHRIIDGFGFAFENYDAIGAYRTEEPVLDRTDTGKTVGKLPVNAQTKVINTFDIDGDYPDGVALTKKLATSEQAAQCFVQNYYKYALGRPQTEQDGCAIRQLTDALLGARGDFRKFVLSLVKTPAFRYRSPL